MYFINQEISAERERSIAIVSAPLNRQNYGPCQYGTPSQNSSPVYVNVVGGGVMGNGGIGGMVGNGGTWGGGGGGW